MITFQKKKVLQIHTAPYRKVLPIRPRLDPEKIEKFDDRFDRQILQFLQKKP